MKEEINNNNKSNEDISRQFECHNIINIFTTRIRSSEKETAHIYLTGTFFSSLPLVFAHSFICTLCSGGSDSSNSSHKMHNIPAWKAMRKTFYGRSSAHCRPTFSYSIAAFHHVLFIRIHRWKSHTHTASHLYRSSYKACHWNEYRCIPILYYCFHIKVLYVQIFFVRNVIHKAC